MIRTKNSLLAAFLCSVLPYTSAYAVNFGLFGDITFDDTTAAGDNPGFSLGALDFYATEALSDDTRAFVEYVFENTGDGLVTDLERLWISKRFSGKLSLAAGRFHSPLGRWNRVYHHGAILQDTVSRPFFLDFEDGEAAILPMHVVGLMASGDIQAGSGSISYELSLANGPSIDTSIAGFSATPGNKPEIEVNDASDPNADKSIALRVVYKPLNIPMQVGAFTMRNVVSESSTGGGSALANRGDTLVSQFIYGLDFYHAVGRLDVLSELYLFDNDNKVGTNGSYKAAAYYIQASYRLNDNLKIVTRYANLDFNQNDSYFRLLGTRKSAHAVLGVRYDINDASAIKMEINRADVNGGNDVTSYSLQWSFLVP